MIEGSGYIPLTNGSGSGFGTFPAIKEERLLGFEPVLRIRVLFFKSQKIAIYLSQGLHKGLRTTGEAFGPQTRT